VRVTCFSPAGSLWSWRQLHWEEPCRQRLCTRASASRTLCAATQPSSVKRWVYDAVGGFEGGPSFNLTLAQCQHKRQTQKTTASTQKTDTRDHCPNTEDRHIRPLPLWLSSCSCRWCCQTPRRQQLTMLPSAAMWTPATCCLRPHEAGTWALLLTAGASHHLDGI
jgi:hypothetical protein